MSFPTPALCRIVALVLFTGTALVGPSVAAGTAPDRAGSGSSVGNIAHRGAPGAAPENAIAAVDRARSQTATLVVATYNVHISAPDADTLADLRRLLAQADVLVVQEVQSAGKKAVIGQVQAETGANVVYSPGRAEDAIIWHPDKMAFQTQGSELLSEPTAVGNPAATIPTKYLMWCQFRLPGTRTSFQVGNLHLAPRPHVDPRREVLLKLELANLANALVNLGFQKPLIGGDYNDDYYSAWLDPLRNIGMLNDGAFFGEGLTTFYNVSDGAPRSFDQWWFRPPTQTDIRPLEHHTFTGSSDHRGVVVSFAVQ